MHERFPARPAAQGGAGHEEAGRAVGTVAAASSAAARAATAAVARRRARRRRALREGRARPRLDREQQATIDARARRAQLRQIVEQHRVARPRPTSTSTSSTRQVRRIAVDAGLRARLVAGSLVDRALRGSLRPGPGRGRRPDPRTRSAGSSARHAGPATARPRTVATAISPCRTISLVGRGPAAGVTPRRPRPRPRRRQQLVQHRRRERAARQLELQQQRVGLEPPSSARTGNRRLRRSCSRPCASSNARQRRLAAIAASSTASASPPASGAPRPDNGPLGCTSSAAQRSTSAGIDRRGAEEAAPAVEDDGLARQQAVPVAASHARREHLVEQLAARGGQREAALRPIARRLAARAHSRARADCRRRARSAAARNSSARRRRRPAASRASIAVALADASRTRMREAVRAMRAGPQLAAMTRAASTR